MAEATPSPRVLLVEDDADHGAMIERAFSRHAVPTVVHRVGSAAGCLAALAAETYVAVFLDYSLPDMTGLELLPAIRARDRWLPVIMVTGQGDERIAIDALAAGATDYVVKTSGYFVSLPTVLRKAIKQQELARENQRLYQALEERLRDSQALLRFARALTATLEYGPLLEHIERDAPAACGMEHGTVVLAAGARLDRPVSGGEVPGAAFTLFETVVRGREPVLTCAAGTPGIATAASPCAQLALPLECRGEVIGMLVLENVRQAAPVTDDQLRVGTAIASQAALAIDNARLYRDARQMLADLASAQERIVQMEILRALGELAGGTAHHLNNLLTIVLGRADLLLQTRLPERAAESLRTICRAARDGAEVVRRIEEFARTKEVHVWKPVDLNEIAHEVVELTKPRWRDAALTQGITIEVRHEAGAVPEVSGHAGSLREALLNLVVNAIEALPAGGHVRIVTAVCGEWATLAVHDDGVGMEPDVVRRAKDPFFTTKGVRRTGLGLSVDYGIVKRHHGEILIDSEPGQGTSVTIRLPLRRAAAATPPAGARPAPAALRLLVVDDEPAVREALAELIEQDGHQVLRASGGADALGVLGSGQPIDAVLTDLSMPGMTGWQLIDAIRDRWPRLPVAIITGWGAEPAADESDGTIVLAKPVGLAELRAALQRLGVASSAGPGGRA